MRWLALFGLMILAMVIAVPIIALIAELPWWGLIGSWMFIGVLAIWILTFFDIWRRADLSAVAAIVWSLVVFIFPLIGTIVYVFTRPGADQIRYKGDAPID
jgi:hypothetical protein